MLPPLTFTPYLRQRVWGGTQLRDRLGRSLPDDQPYGESWELCALPEHDSRAADGPLRGVRLSELWETRRSELWGDAAPPYEGRLFPLLIKWLDCAELLSVQVHPDDAGAQRLIGEPCGKAEAWVFLDTTANSPAYFGLLPGTTPQEFSRRMLDGTVEACLATILPQPGQVIFVPPGSVHALGPGQLLLEIEQPSDATFRVFDYNRPGPDGASRPLHREQALATIDWQCHAPPRAIAKVWPNQPTGVQGTTLLATAWFTLHRFELSQPWTAPFTGQMSAWVVFGGSGTLAGPADGDLRTVRLGDTVLIPASCPPVRWMPGRDGLTLIAATV